VYRVGIIALVGACNFDPGHPTTGGDGGPMIDAAIDAVKPDGTPGSARKRSITIQPTQHGDQTAFPMWFVFDDTQLGQQALTDASDIYFTLPDGSPLELEVQRWNKGAGHLEAWVRVDLLDAAPTLIDLRYGDPGPAHAPNAPVVFSDRFAAVWHLEDALTSTTIVDARGTATGSVIGGIPPTAQAAGVLGGSVAFDGNNDEIQFTNPIAGGISHTMSAWVNVVTPTTGFSSIVTLGNPSGDHARWWHTHYPAVALGFYGGDWMTTGINIDGAGWTMMHWVFDTDTNVSKLYRNGVLAGTSPQHTNPIDTQGTTGAGHIGNAPQEFGPGGNTPNPLHGRLDEVRIASTPRSAGWIATEFANQSSPATFYTVGVEQPAQ
jgi:Concanavalin A-like lectin/glucanases superfamily